MSVIVAGMCLPRASWPAEAPLWELGAGVSGLSLPDYRGSNERTNYLLPIPYFVYRGADVRVDRDGVRGDLYASDRVKLDLSLGAGPPTKSDENRAREGMPDIDPTVEIGGSLKILLAANQVRDRVWSLRLPLRTVVATDLTHLESIGWIFAPHINFAATNTGPGGSWDLGLSFGPLYATEKYHDYFYEVDAQFATSERPTFDAASGYSGARITATLKKRFAKFWVGAFMRYDSLAGAIIEDSPLVKRDDSFMVGVGVAWILLRSEITVPVRREVLR